MRLRYIGHLSLWTVLLALLTSGGAKAAPKKLIQFGAFEPDPLFLRQNIRVMEQTPFDGCVFHINCPRSDGNYGQFSWDCWGRRAFTPAELQPALDDLQATTFIRFTDNFLRFNVTPGDVDWFDDFSAVLNNARLAASVARQGKCKGIPFDFEEYQTALFDYDRQRDANTKSWDDYAAQARLRAGPERVSPGGADAAFD